MNQSNFYEFLQGIDFSSVGAFIGGTAALAGVLVAILGSDISKENKAIKRSIFWREVADGDHLSERQKSYATLAYRGETGKVFANSWAAGRYSLADDYFILLPLLSLSYFFVTSIVEGNQAYLLILVIYAIISPFVPRITMNIMSVKFSRDAVAILFSRGKSVPPNLGPSSLRLWLKTGSKWSYRGNMLFAIFPFLCALSGSIYIFFVLIRLFGQETSAEAYPQESLAAVLTATTFISARTYYNSLKQEYLLHLTQNQQ